ncbi:MAG: hypothetical protein P8X73_03255 [Ignavibacteriaceae bacterium]
MKLLLRIGIVTLLLCYTTIAQQDYSYLDNEKGTSMEPILARAEPLVKDIERDNYEIVRMEYDLIFTEKDTYRNLFEGWTYGIAAFGDYRINDIDLTVYKQSRGEWKKIVEDAENDDVATVTVKPLQNEEYKIVISVYKFNKDYNVGHYGLIIFHE